MNGWRNRVSIRLGDIVDEDCDIIVNAANEDLTPGGGVCGAIHAAAGPHLASACREIGGCDTGQAVLTDAFDLGCRHVIHAVGPIHGACGGAEAELLASCYRESLRLCAAAGCRTIAFPSISTGIYGYPLDEACRIALAAVREGLAAHPVLNEVRLVCFAVGDQEQYETALAEMG